MDKEEEKLLPSNRAEYQAKEEKKRQEVAEQMQALMREDFGRTFNTEHGKRVLAWLMERSGWGKPPLGASPAGDIDQLRTTFNAMELALYIAIRQFIPVNTLMEVEYGHIKPSGTIADTGSDSTGSTKRRTSKSRSGKRTK